jgi:hypothetical protein
MADEQHAIQMAGLMPRPMQRVQLGNREVWRDHGNDAQLRGDHARFVQDATGFLPELSRLWMNWSASSVVWSASLSVSTR